VKLNNGGPEPWIDRPPTSPLSLADIVMSDVQ